MHYDALLKRYSSYGRDTFEALKLLLWAVGVLAGSPKVDVSTPVAIVTALHVIAVGLLSYQVHTIWRFDIVG